MQFQLKGKPDVLFLVFFLSFFLSVWLCFDKRMAFGGFYLGTWIMEDTFIFLGGGGLAARVRTRSLNIHPSIPGRNGPACSGKMGQLFR